EGLAAPRAAFRQRPAPFDRGDPVSHFILAGSVPLVRHQADGSVLTLEIRPGSVPAEASLYSEAYHCAAVACGRAQPGCTRRRLSEAARNIQASAISGPVILLINSGSAASRGGSLVTVAKRLDAWPAWNGARHCTVACNLAT